MQKVFQVTLLLLLVLSFTPSVQAAPEEYVIDPAHSSINFAVPHLMISKVRGDFNQFEGKVLFNPNDLTNSSVQVNIKAVSINTESPDRDKHLRGADFFDIEKYPEITYVSKKIKKQKNLSLCIGTLTMHGVSREVAIPFRILGQVKDPWGKERIVIEGSTLINRQDYGIRWNKAIDGGVLVGNEVKINLTVEAVKK